MKISVVIPCHNAAEYLAQTIGSLLEQTRRVDEIWVILDRCTDDSVKIVQQFGHHVNSCEVGFGNASQTRNFGAQLCAGSAVMFLDADDVLAPEAMAGLVAALETTPDAVALIPWKRLELVGEQWVERPPSTPSRRAGHDLLSNWLTGHYFPPCCVLWSLEAFKQTGGWSEDFCINEDGDLAMRAMILGLPFVLATTGHAYYRRVPQLQSLSGQRFSREGLAGRLRVIEKLSIWLAERSRLREYRMSLHVAFEQICGDCKREGCSDLEALSREMQQLYARQGFSTKVKRRVRSVVRRGRSLTRGRSVHSASQTPDHSEPEGGAESSVLFGTAAAQAAKRGEFMRGGTHLTYATGTLRSAINDSGQLNSIPTVSVIIPTYNRAAQVCRAIQTVLAQTYKDLEVIVVDDASTDNTEAQVELFGDARIRYVRQPTNLNVSAARNRGMREARGQYIAFLDSDDEWLPEKLELQMEIIEKAPTKVGIVYTGAFTRRANGSVPEWQPTHRGDVLSLMLMRNIAHGGPASILMRRNAVRVVGFFDDQSPAMEDYDYWIRLARFFHFDFVNRPLVLINDAVRTDRRSLIRDADVRARKWLFNKHRLVLTRAGVAHRFLLASARRRLFQFDGADRIGAVGLVVRALGIAPTDRRSYRDAYHMFFSNTIVESLLTRLLGLMRSRGEQHESP